MQTRATEEAVDVEVERPRDARLLSANGVAILSRSLLVMSLFVLAADCTAMKGLHYDTIGLAAAILVANIFDALKFERPWSRVISNFATATTFILLVSVMFH